MKKVLVYMLVLFCLFGCTTTNQENKDIEFGNTPMQEEYYLYEHGVDGYQFEKWKYDGDSLSFDYTINNDEKECEFGLVFLVNGIKQEYEVEGQRTSMYLLNMNTGDKKTLSIKMNPRIDEDRKDCNVNAFLILNPSKHIEDAKQYGHNHSISSVGTIILEMDKAAVDKSINVSSVDVQYQNIPEDVIKDNTKDGINMLDSNIYIQKNTSDDNQVELHKDTPVQFNIYGKQGRYRLLEFCNNEVTHMYDVDVRQNQYSSIMLNVDMKENDNAYYLIVPLDTQDPYDYVMMSQSERLIVK